MEFIKTIGPRRRGKRAGFGTLRISDGFISLKLNAPEMQIDKIGVIKGGIGVVLKQSIIPKKTPSVASRYKYDEDTIPVELQGEKYRFSIPAEKLSDTEYVFMFKNAKMLNKK